jgi:predicted helicase
LAFRIGCGSKRLVEWGSNAEEALKNQNPPVTRLNLLELQQAKVDWENLEEGVHGEASSTSKKTIRQHQKTALERNDAKLINPIRFMENGSYYGT